MCVFFSVCDGREVDIHPGMALTDPYVDVTDLHSDCNPHISIANRLRREKDVLGIESSGGWEGKTSLMILRGEECEWKSHEML